MSAIQKLTAIAFESTDTLGVWIGRLVEHRGIVAQADSLGEVLDDLLIYSLATMPGHVEIVHDVEASAKEQAIFREVGRRADAAAKERMIPASQVAQQLAGLLITMDDADEDSSFDEGMKTAFDLLNSRIRAVAAALGLTLP